MRILRFALSNLRLTPNSPARAMSSIWRSGFLPESDGSGNGTGPKYIKPLISANELKNALDVDSKNICCVDASWHMPGGSRNADQEFFNERIPGATRFDIDKIADLSSPMPHMLPDAEIFHAAVLKDMDIGQDTAVVVYGQNGTFSSSRVWWSFHVFGHKNVCILDGGLPAWKENGGAIESGELRSSVGQQHQQQQQHIPSVQIDLVSTCQQVSSHSSKGGLIIDARASGRFQGGHIPGSLNVPFTEVVQADVLTFKSPEEIEAAFKAVGVEVQEPQKIIVSCGSGVTAEYLLFALHWAGRDINATSMYDGSWAEWGNPKCGLPIEKVHNVLVFGTASDPLLRIAALQLHQRA